MSISKEYIGKISENVLKLLDKEKVASSSDLDRLMNQTFPVGEKTKEQILVESRPSRSGTMAKVISYTVPGCGIPLEVRLNEEQRYSVLIVKGNFNLKGYEPFAQDVFGNIAQDKRLGSTDISQIKSELKKLI
jgi:hypothetical protein